GSAGRAAGVSVGTTTISAALSGKSGATSLSVTDAVLASIEVDPAKPQIVKGTQQRFTAIGIFSDSTIQDLTVDVAWGSSSAGVATISNAAGGEGRATGASAGVATISAMLSGTGGQATLTVTNAVLTAVAVTPASPSMPKGTTLQLRAAGSFSDGTTQDLTED